MLRAEWEFNIIAFSAKHILHSYMDPLRLCAFLLFMSTSYLREFHAGTKFPYASLYELLSMLGLPKNYLRVDIGVPVSA